MSERAAENDADDEWTCLKPGCDLGVDQHNLAMVVEHALHDEPNFTVEDAQGVADRTLAKVARAFGLDDDTRTTPPTEARP